MKMLFLTLVTVISLPCTAQTTQFYGKEPLAHTYSIVARDTETGEMGVAVQSHWFSVGSLVIWGEAGVGVVATQSFVNPSFGPRGLSLLKAGLTPQMAVDALLEVDEAREVRQLAILDKNGKVAAHTGKNCIPAAGQIVGDNFSVQANLMANDKVWPAMAKAFKETKGPLAERMLAALQAAQKEGGDIRGQQSAALLVVKAEATGNIWEDRVVDLRVDDHATPVDELKRLLKVHRAYEHMNQGDLAVEHGNMEEAMKEYTAAEEMFPNNLEMKFWHAVTLTNTGQLDEALPLYKEVFSKDNNWKILLPRLKPIGLLQVDDKGLEKILKLK
ncbi:MAG: DUF1028 domain-containing protein [Bacteroidota bacterium]